MRDVLKGRMQEKREAVWTVREKANKAWQRAQDQVLEIGRKKRLECKKTGAWTKTMEAIWKKKQKAYIEKARGRKEEEVVQQKQDEETQEKEWFERANQLDLPSATKVLSQLGIASTRQTSISGGYTSEKELSSLLMQWEGIGDAATHDDGMGMPSSGENKSSPLDEGTTVVSYDKFLLIVLSLEATQEDRSKLVEETSGKPWPVPTKGWLKMDYVDECLEPRRSELTLSLYVCGLLHRLRKLVDVQLKKRMKAQNDKVELSNAEDQNRHTRPAEQYDVCDYAHSSILENLLCQVSHEDRTIFLSCLLPAFLQLCFLLLDGEHQSGPLFFCNGIHRIDFECSPCL
jgi:hypothetical protein